MGAPERVSDLFSSDASRIAPVPLLYNSPLPFATPQQLKRHLHDLSNRLTGVLGNLELVAMSAAEGEVDQLSLDAALCAARESLLAVRELKQQFDQQLEFDRELAHHPDGA